MNGTIILLSFGKHDINSIPILLGLEDKIRDLFSVSPEIDNYFLIEGFGHTKVDTDLFYRYHNAGLSFLESHYRVHLTKLLKETPREVQIKKFIAQQEHKGDNFITAHYRLMDKISKDFNVNVLFENFSDAESEMFVKILKEFKELGAKNVQLFLKTPKDPRLIENTRLRLEYLRNLADKRNKMFNILLNELYIRTKNEGRDFRLFARLGTKHSNLVEILETNKNGKRINIEYYSDDYTTSKYDIQELAMLKSVPINEVLLKSITFDALNILLKGNLYVLNKDGEIIGDLLNKDFIFQDLFTFLMNENLTVEEKRGKVIEILKI